MSGGIEGNCAHDGRILSSLCVGRAECRRTLSEVDSASRVQSSTS
jgi:hypothetical protein